MRHIHSFGAQRVQKALLPLRGCNPSRGQGKVQEGNKLIKIPTIVGIWLAYALQAFICQKLCLQEIMLGGARKPLRGRA